MVSESAGQVPYPRRDQRASVEELARRKGVRPVRSLDEMTRDVFSTDDELEEFANFVRAERDSDRR